MTLAQQKLLVMAAWAGTVLTIAVVFAIDKPLLWVVFGSWALIPVVIGNRLWGAPEATLSELIVRSR